MSISSSGNANLLDNKAQLAKAKKVMSQLEDLEIECFGEFLKINILKKGINIDIYKNIIKDL
ncbi:conserved Plasmodium protein, unknown function [Plasmodium chabaudi chabaudi]|uniref:Uncharacterized protein n=2 Tax=Plasmodium chabaudi TaxID=5825 RepID=A0A077TMF4_PLACU|nr:conserved Plasmodium protein, unknown function [Plasmodium chabaudi chabaudi]SCM22950.1 conserved Plasmodium protein, unknown function [Plasmodium chabaudi adami]SCN61731.1 conserved Plasmodium protein, unknown function [Plasmodium chabaudi chabaudi]VTZ69512.1 conserved Plasmodium protein, unknown function [Plasmodium chabaudi chabaudi]|eukprot:XP_016654160.1 conserved Plasmodium protein, unknown function [Plasmodium chabaudi chabaudi]